MQVEELHEGEVGSVVARRFTATADGVCVYERSFEPLVDPISKTAVPVFRTVSAYELRPECTRLFARKLHARKVLALEQEQGDRRETAGVSLRLSYRAFGREVLVVASGQIHGSVVRVLHVVNAYLPPGEVFRLPGMVGDPDPVRLTGVPAPVDDLAGSLEFHRDLLRRRPDDGDLMIDTFALLCASGERAEAEAVLARWSKLSAGTSPSQAPCADPPRLLPEMLLRMLPPK